jgi:hypothetical protein
VAANSGVSLIDSRTPLLNNCVGMRYLTLTAVARRGRLRRKVRLTANGIARDVDARCGCVKDPNSKLCEMVKAGFYEPRDWRNAKPLNLGMDGTLYRPATKTTRTAAPARPEQAASGGIGAQRLPAFPASQRVTGGRLRFRKTFPVSGIDGRVVWAGGDRR